MDIYALIESAGYPTAAVVFAAALLIAAVRMNCNVQFTDLLRWRDERKKESDWRKQVDECRHAWTLFPSSPYSRCNFCAGVIATTTLQHAEAVQLPRLCILGVARGLLFSPKGRIILVSDPIGRE